jgi:glucosamine 6-phosphate synthetase-like amidotransferase/phosphosugar isomerase protein
MRELGNNSGAFIVGMEEENYYISDNLENVLAFTNKLLILEPNELLKLSGQKIVVLDPNGRPKQNIIMEINKN